MKSSQMLLAAININSSEQDNLKNSGIKDVIGGFSFSHEGWHLSSLLRIQDKICIALKTTT